MAYWFKARELFMQKGWRPERKTIPYAVIPVTWEGWALTMLWIGAVTGTLVFAFSQGADLFLWTAISSVVGTWAVLWMLRDRVRPARR